MTSGFLEKLTRAQRHNLHLIQCSPLTLGTTQTYLNNLKIPSLNIGNALSEKLSSIKQTKFLNLECQEILHKLIESNAAEVVSGKIKMIAVYNLGILLEPILGLNSEKILKELSKAVSIIIIWENTYQAPGILSWTEQADKYRFDFSDTNLQRVNINYEI